MRTSSLSFNHFIHPVTKLPTLLSGISYGYCQQKKVFSGKIFLHALFLKKPWKTIYQCKSL